MGSSFPSVPFTLLIQTWNEKGHGGQERWAETQKGEPLLSLVMFSSPKAALGQR